MNETEIRLRCMEAAVVLLASQDPEIRIQASQFTKVADALLEWVLRPTLADEAKELP